MSTDTNKNQEIGRRTVVESIGGALRIMGRIALVAAVSLVYSLFITVTLDWLASNGVLDTVGRTGTTTIRWAFSLPVVVAGAWAAATLVDLLTGYTVDPRDVALTVGGLVTIGVSGWLWSLQYGVI